MENRTLLVSLDGSFGLAKGGLSVPALANRRLQQIPDIITLKNLSLSSMIALAFVNVKAIERYL